MHSHPMGLDVWFLVGHFIYCPTSCVRTTKALARLCGCASSPALFAYVISTIISWTCSVMPLIVVFEIVIYKCVTHNYCSYTRTSPSLSNSLRCVTSLPVYIFTRGLWTSAWPWLTNVTPRTWHYISTTMMNRKKIYRASPNSCRGKCSKNWN